MEGVRVADVVSLLVVGKHLVFSLSLLKGDISLGFSLMPFISLRKFPSFPSLLNVFVRKGHWFL